MGHCRIGFRTPRSSALPWAGSPFGVEKSDGGGRLAICEPCRVSCASHTMNMGCNEAGSGEQNEEREKRYYRDNNLPPLSTPTIFVAVESRPLGGIGSFLLLHYLLMSRWGQLYYVDVSTHVANPILFHEHDLKICGVDKQCQAMRADVI